MTKTFCLVKADGTTDLLQGEYVFEVDTSYPDMQRAMNVCLSEKRPHSTHRQGGCAWTTLFADRLPILFKFGTFTKVKPHEYY